MGSLPVKAALACTLPLAANQAGLKACWPWAAPAVVASSKATAWASGEKHSDGAQEARKRWRSRGDLVI
ncbi:hypothetical protein D3C85_1590270 [compost metagenome]